MHLLCKGSELKMKYYYYILLISLTSISYSQSSISSCFNFSSDVLLLEIDYKKNISNNSRIVLTSELGDYGRNNYSSSTDIPYIGKYNVLNFFDINKELFKSYDSHFKGVGIGLKIENIWRVKKNDKIFFGLLLKNLIIRDQYTMYFSNKFSNINEIAKTKTISVFHLTICSGLYLGYSYSLNNKLNLETKVNMSYFFPIHTSYYKIWGVDYQTIGLEPNISIGLNFIIKK